MKSFIDWFVHMERLITWLDNEQIWQWYLCKISPNNSMKLLSKSANLHTAVPQHCGTDRKTSNHAQQSQWQHTSTYLCGQVVSWTRSALMSVSRIKIENKIMSTRSLMLPLKWCERWISACAWSLEIEMRDIVGACSNADWVWHRTTPQWWSLLCLKCSEECTAWRLPRK